jgi:hypothetical protein
MASLYVEEEGIELRRGEGRDGDDLRLGLGSSGVYESGFETPGALFRAMRREHGRCTGHVHVDRDGRTLTIGWVFLKRRRYEDSPDTYLAETWVTVHEREPTRTIEHHYAEVA